MVHAAIFDMDGLLIDSEPLWRDAEIAVFASIGLRLGKEECKETIGLRVDEAVQYWYSRFPWNGPSPEAICERLIAGAAELIFERGRLMDGAEKLIAELHAARIQLAIASSSPMTLIRAVVDRFGLGSYFSVLHSAEHERLGKPHPAVYQTAILRLGVSPRDCIAFEDSLVGVRAAKAAGATVIAVPADEDAGNAEFGMADIVLGSLEEFSLEHVRELWRNTGPPK